MGENIKAKLQAGHYRRQARYAGSEKDLLEEEAKKNAWGRFSVLVRKYNIEQDDVEELMEVSMFLL